MKVLSIYEVFFTLAVWFSKSIRSQPAAVFSKDKVYE